MKILIDPAMAQTWIRIINCRLSSSFSQKNYPKNSEQNTRISELGIPIDELHNLELSENKIGKSNRESRVLRINVTCHRSLISFLWSSLSPFSLLFLSLSLRDWDGRRRDGAETVWCLKIGITGQPNFTAHLKYHRHSLFLDLGQFCEIRPKFKFFIKS